MSTPGPPRSWLRVALYGAGLGWLAGGLEGLAVASSIDLQLGFGEALVLMLCSLACGAATGVALGLPAGLLLQLAGRGKDDYQLQALGMGLVGFGLAAWYFWPIALGLVRLQRWAGGAAGFLVPLGFLGTVYFNARHWLRKVDLGWRPRLGFTLLSLALALLLALLDAAWLVQRPRGAGAMALAGDHNVLLVTIDTLRRDHLSAYGEDAAVPTPRFDALAAEGVLYLDAVTPLPETGPSHASMFTSLHPTSHGVVSNGHTLSAGFTTLAERLSDEGYATAAFVSSFAVDSRTGLDQGFQIYDDDFFPAMHGISEIRLVALALRGWMRFGDPLKLPFLLERSARSTNQRAARWLGEQGERPFFCWVHYFEPHAPYEPHGGRAAPGGVDHRHILAHEDQVTYTPELVGQLRQLYAGEVLEADARLGELLDTLQELGHAGDTLVVVTADHGEMLGEHGYHFNHHSIFDEAVRVPLAIRAPALRPGTRLVDAQVRVMDIPATVLEYLDLDPMEPTQGVELLGYAEKFRHQSLITTLVGRKTGALDKGSLFGLRAGRPHDEEGRPFKYVWDVDSETEQLFDLSADPGESSDIGSEQPELLQRARRIVAEDAGRVEQASEPMDGATENALKALGYID